MTETGYLTATSSPCTACGRLLPARLHVQDDGVWLHKHCPEHGPQSARIWSDAADYVKLNRFHRRGAVPKVFATDASRGCPDACGLCTEHEQHVCMPIIEITDHCDLACPICLANNRSRFHLSRRQVADMLDRLIDSESQIDVVNLSGGEPTLNPAFREIVDECVSRPEILCTSVSTNGLRLARDPELLEFLAERDVIISLQFDGLDDRIYEQLRGRPLLAEKRRVIEAVGEREGRMSLTMTVARGVNDQRLGDATGLLFECQHISSAMFQPMAYVGSGAAIARPADAVTIPDVIASLDGTADGTVTRDDFSPLPCSHPACFSLAFYLAAEDGGFVSIKQAVDADRYMDMIQNRGMFGADHESLSRIEEAVYALWSGPAALAPDSQRTLRAVRRVLTAVTAHGREAGTVMATAQRHIKSIFIHQFMDRYSFDLSRARKCCQVYPQPDGRLMPACVYNCLRRTSWPSSRQPIDS